MKIKRGCLKVFFTVKVKRHQTHSNGGMMFALTYLAAILLAAGIAFYRGIKHGYPKRTWMLILTTGLIFFILGEKLAAFSSDQWVELFTRFHLPDATRMTILGGILGLATGLILAKKTLKFNQPVFDHFALAWPFFGFSMNLSGPRNPASS